MIFGIIRSSNDMNDKEQKSYNVLILDLQKMISSRIYTTNQTVRILHVIKTYLCVPNLSISSKDENNKNNDDGFTFKQVFKNKTLYELLFM